MRARLKLKPGQRGTKALVDIYGDALVCVRYRYDEARHIRVKTVELIIEQKEWTPPKPRFADNERVPVLIRFTESKLKTIAKAAGGRWDPEKKLWFIRFDRIKGTELEKHIVVDALTVQE